MLCRTQVRNALCTCRRYGWIGWACLIQDCWLPCTQLNAMCMSCGTVVGLNDNNMHCAITYLGLGLSFMDASCILKCYLSWSYAWHCLFVLEVNVTAVSYVSHEWCTHETQSFMTATLDRPCFLWHYTLRKQEKTAYELYRVMHWAAAWLHRMYLMGNGWVMAAADRMMPWYSLGAADVRQRPASCADSCWLQTCLPAYICLLDATWWHVGAANRLVNAQTNDSWLVVDVQATVS